MGLLSRLFEPEPATGQAARGAVTSDRARAQGLRGHSGMPSAPASRGSQPDDVPSLVAANQALVLEINRSAGDLPPLGVVLARAVTDTVGRVLRSPEAARLDISVRVAINGVLTDYLPGSIRTYVAAVRAAGPGGAPAATDALVEQLATLRRSVEDLARASAERDVQALEVHGRFLETKFSGSDLAL
ncbi:hypothetical protein G9U51_10705 [Calidifontibacter sp. DB0510]|uniref:Uncharacterized protein n=1 Tax=Metallococcus carri TaxID=1656884 RepID=A0A967B1G0_9MICO|nr:hypothetical protein [Metallococcus carri]NHN56244.1 hypothetical protein [Metallococcus carri]NOP38704.1 hypothetical protein [Calidifontibacter sp. DB2511S]